MGKDRLSTEDAARILRISPEYCQKLQDTGQLNLDEVAVKTQVPVGGQEKELENAIKSGRRIIEVKKREQSAEETLTKWAEQPIGRARLHDPRTVRNTELLSRGLDLDFKGDVTSPSDLRKAIKQEDQQHYEAEERAKEERRGRGRPKGS